MSDQAVTVTVPLWALKFILARGNFQDAGPYGEGPGPSTTAIHG
jgi:hypothetical protein